MGLFYNTPSPHGVIAVYSFSNQMLVSVLQNMWSPIQKKCSPDVYIDHNYSYTHEMSLTSSLRFLIGRLQECGLAQFCGDRRLYRVSDDIG